MASSRPASTAANVIGVPIVPPASVSRRGTAIRQRLIRLQRAMAPPPLRIMEGALSLIEHRALVALCAAGVPEALSGPTTVEDLAARLPGDVGAPGLTRLLRFAASEGWVRLDRRGRVRPTRLTPFLRNDHPGGWRAWVDFVAGDEVTGAVAALALDRPGDGFAAVNGSPFFDWMADHPDRWAIFDEAMAAGARMHALALDAALDWGDSADVCDVGGGTGELARTLLDLHPGWSAVTFDLPEVVARAVEHPRLRAVGGDAFESIPDGHDTYLLVNVLHDWGDDDCRRWFANLARAMGPDARLVVVEFERVDRPGPGMETRVDLLMAALTGGGKERSADEFAALAKPEGLALESTTPLVSGDLAHTFRRAV